MPDENKICDLLLLTQAANAARTSRGNFHRLVQRQFVPPPVIELPQRRWSTDQLERWRLGQIKSNEYGLWYEWNHNLECWRKLPNQYVSTLPLDAA